MSISGEMGSFLEILSIAFESTLNFLQNRIEPKNDPLDPPPYRLNLNQSQLYYNFDQINFISNCGLACPWPKPSQGKVFVGFLPKPSQGKKPSKKDDEIMNEFKQEVAVSSP